MQREAVLEALRSLGIPEKVLQDVPDLPAGVQGLLVYGSRARGDSIEGSDVDLLALSGRTSPSTYSGLVNISYYTSDQLKSGVGTLFGAHLRRDAKIVSDPTGRLQGLIDELGEVDTTRLFSRVKNMSKVFGALDTDLPKYLAGLLREARYLLRSSLYAGAIAAGDPCFSVREIAVRHNDPSLVQLLASRHVGPPEAADLRECLIRLESLLGELPLNPHGSLEALIVNEWDHGGDLLAIGFMALGLVGADTGYAEVDKILL
ncbi:nucleotidyltransferase domain-containing protein [Mycobacterium sp. SMC-8]|uniref:nucleotidyltransferase domain-containing protein n=1 Tax=Mycobacterium sp. SMC-8 TaxID=2857060 RepID=UPI0021B3AA38|nr:nucleotidyltransferase domain-containing protein [Mycobacterium sp. SMC-8]UXA11584.1 nucleotidyltransferase domain-containing protein [Mycobacterium sp. SMC-8]